MTWTPDPERGRVREIRQLGDPVLRTTATPVTRFDDKLRQLIDDMFASMYEAEGVGLAANQIGVELDVFVYDCPPDDDRVADDRVADDRVADDRVADDQAADDRGADVRGAGDQVADERAPDDQRDVDRAADPHQAGTATAPSHGIGYVINPKLDRVWGQTLTWDEGCLSLRGLTEPTDRSDCAAVTGLDIVGDPVRVVGSGLLGRCLQHETDHLRGMVYLDRVPRLRRARAIRRLEKLREADKAPSTSSFFRGR